MPQISKIALNSVMAVCDHIEIPAENINSLWLEISEH